MKPSKNYLLYVGNAYPHKNLERLLMAVLQLKALPNFKLVLVGKKDYFYKRLNRKAKEMGLGGKVVFCGAVSREELTRFYKNAQALVLPSLMEGFGLPGLEAMAVGCPVVCSNIPALKEIYGEAACYFDPLDIKDMADKIKRVICDTMIRETLVKKGLERVKKYSWQKMARETFEVYKELRKGVKNAT